MRVVVIFLLLCLFGCRTINHVPVKTEVVENDSVVSSDSVRANKEVIRNDSSSVSERTEKSDSTIIRDSSVIVVNEQGDVIKTERFNTKEVYRNKEYERIESKYRELELEYKELQVKYDALFFEKQKTIDVPYPVEKPLSRWQNFKLSVGGFAISGIIVLIIVGVGYMVYKIKK